jgi:hypothetical protein
LKGALEGSGPVQIREKVFGPGNMKYYHGGDEIDAAQAVKVMDVDYGYTRAETRVASADEPGLLWRAPEDNGHHDYQPSWDYEPREEHDPEFAKLAIRAAQSEYQRTKQPFELWDVDLTHTGAVAMYINGTCGYPVVLVDLEAHRGYEDQLGKSINHELKHAIQEREGREYDEDEAESDDPASKHAAMEPYLYHGTNNERLPSILKSGMPTGSFWGTAEMADWFSKGASEDEGAPVILRIPLSRFNKAALAIDNVAIQEPITEAIGKDEEELYAEWEAVPGEGTWQDSLRIYHSVKYNAPMKIGQKDVWYDASKPASMAVKQNF